MENKKTKIAIIILSILIIFLIVIVYFFNSFNTKQTGLLTQELNKILESDLVEDNIDFDIKTEKNYAKVESSIKEYISKLKNIYIEMEQMTSGMNPNSIFSAQNLEDKNLDEIEEIINEYKQKSRSFIVEYENLVAEQMIKDNINNVDISIRKSYYTNLYNEIMLSDIMKEKYNKLEEEIKNEKGRLYEKLNKIEKMKTFLEEHEDSWEIKEDKIQFTNLNRMTEYYNLLNQIIL